MKSAVTKIDWKEFEELCQIGSPLAELAAYFECTPGEIEELVQQKKGMSFEQYWNEQNEILKQRLREALSRLHQKGKPK